MFHSASGEVLVTNFGKFCQNVLVTHIFLILPAEDMVFIYIFLLCFLSWHLIFLIWYFVFRYQLNLKKTKVEEYPPKKTVGCPTQQLAVLLNSSYNAEDFTDEMKPMSRSLVGRNTNICKIRTMEFMRNECNQGLLCFMRHTDTTLSILFICDNFISS